MSFQKILPVWYGVELETARNALIGVGSLSRTGFIFPKL